MPQPAEPTDPNSPNPLLGHGAPVLAFDVGGTDIKATLPTDDYEVAA